jgi:hypothetical protein
MKRLTLLFGVISITLFLAFPTLSQERTSRKELQGYWVIEPTEGRNKYPIYVIFIGNKEFYFFDNPNEICKNKDTIEEIYGFNDSCEIYTWEDLKDSGYYYFSEASRYYGKEDHVKGSPCGIIMGGVHLDQMTKKDTIMILTYLGGQTYTIYKKIPRLPEHVEKCLEERGIEYKIKKKNNH